MVLLVKNNLNTIAVLISKALIDLNINHDEFVSVNNVLKEYDNTKTNKKTKNKKQQQQQQQKKKIKNPDIK